MKLVKMLSAHTERRIQKYIEYINARLDQADRDASNAPDPERAKKEVKGLRKFHDERFASLEEEAAMAEPDLVLMKLMARAQAKGLKAALKQGKTMGVL